jgi:hypothetical protein
MHTLDLVLSILFDIDTVLVCSLAERIISS